MARLGLPAGPFVMTGRLTVWQPHQVDLPGPLLRGGGVSPAVTSFAAHIKAGTPMPEEWYHLPAGLQFLGSRAFGSALMIKDEYMEMYEYLESDDDNGRLQWRQVVVTGIESGVGTSMFLVYYLLRRLHEGKAVLWHAPLHSQAAIYYHFTPRRRGARVQQLTHQVAEQLLKSKQGVYYALDGVKPSMPAAFRWSQAVLARSPEVDDCQQFLCAEPNNRVSMRLLLWQQYDVLDLSQVAHPGLTVVQVLKRMARCGGNPRDIFDDRYNEALQHLAKHPELR